MKVVINIPKDFEGDYIVDKFKDCFSRLYAMLIAMVTKRFRQKFYFQKMIMQKLKVKATI